MKVKSYHDLVAWQKGIELSKEAYKTIHVLPAEERFELGSQMRRAAISISSNIAEGQQRGGTKEFVHFLQVARGSNGELQTQLILCAELGFVSHEHIAQAVKLSNEVGRLLNNLTKSLEQ